MNKLGLKYSAICLGSGLFIWYFAAKYYEDVTPGRLVHEIAEYGILETLYYDAKNRSIPFGMASRPLAYVGLAGLVISLIMPSGKKREEKIPDKKED